MATVINNPHPDVIERTTIERSDGGVGWGVAVIILLAVIAVGAYFLLHYSSSTDQNSTPTNDANINVSIPIPGADNSDGNSSDNNSGASNNAVGY